jgi:hypothetical protein
MTLDTNAIAASANADGEFKLAARCGTPRCDSTSAPILIC